jgi:hypothetical protein
LKIDILMQEVFFFSKNKIFHGNLPEAKGFRELDYMQYELGRFGQFIIIELSPGKLFEKNHFNFDSGKQFKKSGKITK